MDLHPWDLWKIDGRPNRTLEIVGTLETVLKEAPDPGAKP
jgi:hypothetical protein